MRLLALVLVGTAAVAVSACDHPYPPRTSGGPPAPSLSATTPSLSRTTTLPPTLPPTAGPTAHSPATMQVTVRPVTGSGEPAAGYRVTTEVFDTFLCGDGPSPVAVSPNIRYCGYSATDTAACWKSAVPSTVLCLRDPFGHTLARIRYTGTFAPIPAIPRPTPQALVLDDGTRCQARNGGAWSTVPGQPGWVGWFWCTGGVDVYGPRSGNGIDRSAAEWTVHTVPETGQQPVARHAVVTAYYVGTA